MSIYVIRHAHTTWNGPPHRFQGRLHVPLSKEGIHIARKLGKKIKRPKQIITSPAKRCIQTIHALFGEDYKQVTLDERLWEIDNGYFQGKLLEDVAIQYAKELDIWMNNPSRIRPGDGELLEEMLARVLSCLSETFEKMNNNSDTLIVTHAGPIRVMLCHSKGVSLDSFHKMKVQNLEIYQLEKLEGLLALSKSRNLFTDGKHRQT